MSDQTSFLPASQSAFLASLPETTENQLITGFDSFSAIQFCTPGFLGCRICIGANVVSSSVTLSIQANTPVGGFSKAFKITKNISFTWNPVGVFKVEMKIANFKKTSSSFSFNAGIGVCLKVPFFGWKCASYNHTFSIPTALPSPHQALLSTKSNGDDVEINDRDYSTLILLQALLEEKEGCNCN